MYPAGSMEQVLEYTIPVLHPVAVHVPIALLPAAAVVLLGWLVRDRVGWLIAAAWLQAAGFVGAVVALRSGEAMEEQSEGVPIVEKLVHTHEEAAELTVWLAGLLVLMIVGSLLWHRRAVRRPGVPLPWRAVVSLLGLSVAGLVLWTAHVGGVMVWGVPR